MTRSLGWKRPNTEQQIRALRMAHPEAGASVLAKVTPAPTGSLIQYTCDLDQGALGSCQSNGPAQAFYVAMAVAIAQGLSAIGAFILARLWLYYSLRWIEGTVDEDAGGNIGDAFRILAAKGVPPESAYPYDISKFKQHPGPEVDMLGYDSKGQINVNYYPISSTGKTFLTDMEKAITSQRAVVFGCMVSEAFCSSQPSGIVQAPGPNDQIAGGHCLTIIGYNHAARKALVKNSWGKDWGDADAGPGCFWMSYDYLTDPNYGASDCWIIEAVPGGVGT